MKTCVECKIEKETILFNKNKSRKDGLQSRCKTCDQNKARERYRSIPSERKNARLRGKKNKEVNRQFVYEFLKKNSCSHCGETDPVVLEFDHIEPSKKYREISKLVSYSRKTLEKEIEKCQVLCANCHRRKTADQFGWYKWVVS